ncbi:MAG: TonB family protein [Bacteroidaceae bacterium]|nr:TonB family protein [Bacteroidaceae bacterium]
MNKVMNSFRYGLLIMAALVLLSNSCYGKTNNRKDYGLRGSVCAVVEKNIEFSIKFGEVVPTGKSNDTIYYFLKNGNVYAEVFSPNKYKRFEYDEHNNLTEEMCVKVGKGQEYRIDNNLYHLNDTVDHKFYQYVYNSGGRLEEVKFFEFKRWLGDMEQYYRIVYSYDSNGKKIVYRNEFSIDKEEIYNGSVRKTKDHCGFNSTRITTETLNAKGRPTKREISIDNEHLRTITISYNEYGDEVKILHQWSDGSRSVETTKYVYDQNGNWLKRLHFVGDKLKTWTEREITYAVSGEDYSRKLEEVKMIEAKSQIINDMVKHEQDSIQTVEKVWEEEVAKGGPFAIDVDENAQFPGGEGAYSNWFLRNFHMPAEAAENGEYGRVIVECVVECDGSISFVRIKKSVSEAIDKEALRLVKSMPKWKPAMKDGQPVRSRFIIPMMFRND